MTLMAYLRSFGLTRWARCLARVARQGVGDHLGKRQQKFAMSWIGGNCGRFAAGRLHAAALAVSASRAARQASAADTLTSRRRPHLNVARRPLRIWA